MHFSVRASQKAEVNLPGMGKILDLRFTLVVFCFVVNCPVLITTSTPEQQISNAGACSPRNPECYFKRFGNLTLHRVDPVEVGHVRKLNLIEGREHEIVTVAMRPPIFEIPNFLSSEECDYIVVLAKEKGMETSHTLKEGVEQDTKSLGKNTLSHFQKWDQNQDGVIDTDEMVRNLETELDFTSDKETLLEMYSALNLDEDRDERISFDEFQHRNVSEMAKYIGKVKDNYPHTKSRHSRQAWIPNYSTKGDKFMSTLLNRVQRMTQLPLELIAASEYIQVVSYGPLGHYNCHLDSDFIRPNRDCCHYLDSDLANCRICRYVTVLYFLDNVNDGGETAFPIADNSTFDEEVWKRDPRNACNLAKNCYKANVVVKPEKGKAVMWYNHHVDNATGWLGQVDEYAFHGGCDVRRGTKWIANTWISVGEYRDKDIWNWIEIAQQQQEEDEEKIVPDGKELFHTSDASAHEEL